MDQERDRIQADLRGLLQGDVRCDDVFVQMYASDASIFEIKPLGVVRPRSTADVVVCVEYAAQNQIPIHARGAGTGLAGESLGPGLVIDFAHYMRRILSVDAESVRVQPGVVLGQLDAYLSRFGRRFGPNPANHDATTIGSVVALDAGGSHWLKYGSARDHVLELKVVLADGTVAQLGRHATTDPSSDPPAVTQLARDVRRIVEDHRSLIDTHRPQAPASRSGYRLHDLIDNDQVDLARLIVGSEGTLALVTQATLRTSTMPRHVGVALLLFERLESATQAALDIARLDVAACDLMDRRLMRLAAESDPRFNALLPHATEALLLVEVHGETAQEVRDRALHIVNLCRRRKKLAVDAKVAVEADDVELFWQLSKRVVPTLYRLKGSTRPLPFVEDIVIPPNVVPSFLLQVQNILKKHQVTASIFGHIGHGQLHIRPFLDLGDPDQVRRMQHLARDLYLETLAVKGSVSGEHGDGLSRTWFLREQFGPLYPVLGMIKRRFDPQGILNPGKIVDDHGQALTQNLRPVSPVSSQGDLFADSNDPDSIPQSSGGTEVAEIVKLELAWTQADITHTARACNGCGGCRTTAPLERMCPIFRYAPSEEASPRAKANLMRAVLTGRLDPTALKSQALKSIADLCVNCHQCRLECPAEVDIPRLMTECKAQFVTDNGLSLSDWFLTHLDVVSTWASLVRPFTNWGLGNRTMRWLLEKTFGVAQGRKLPRIASRSFLRHAGRRRLTRPSRRSGRKVLYFVDVFANWYDTQLADALVAVMEHNGVSVYVHPQQMQSAMAMISLGAVERARPICQRNVMLLADAVRQGYHIVATEPAAALALTREYPALLGDEDSLLVAQNTSEACAYLWQMHQQGQLELDLKPVNVTVGYHEPCHVRAMQSNRPGAHLLELIPGVTVRPFETGCSGMAGTYGLKRENYRSSLRAGWGLITAMREPLIQAGATQCSACKLQMAQGTNKPIVHPLKLLALAYGLMPEISTQHSLIAEDLVVT